MTAIVTRRRPSSVLARVVGALPAAAVVGVVAAVLAACGPTTQSGDPAPASPTDTVPVPAAPAPAAEPAPSPSAGADVSQPPAQAPLAAVATSGFTEPVELVLRDAAALATAWRTLHAGAPAEAPPAVDFARQMVVLLAIGERSSGGHDVRVDEIVATGDGATVRYTVTSPGASCMTTMAITSPAVAVPVARAAGAVRFERREVVREC
jgi:hypothetical protein